MILLPPFSFLGESSPLESSRESILNRKDEGDWRWLVCHNAIAQQGQIVISSWCLPRFLPPCLFHLLRPLSLVTLIWSSSYCKLPIRQLLPVPCLRSAASQGLCHRTRKFLHTLWTCVTKVYPMVDMSGTWQAISFFVSFETIHL